MIKVTTSNRLIPTSQGKKTFILAYKYQRPTQGFKLHRLCFCSAYGQSLKSFSRWKDLDEQQQAAFHFSFPSATLLSYERIGERKGLKMYYGERFKAEFGHRLNLTADELDKIDFTDTNYRQNHFRKGRNFKVPRSFYRKVQKEWKMLPETKRQQYEKRLQPRHVEQLVFPLAAPSIPAREKRSSNKLRREKKAK